MDADKQQAVDQVGSVQDRKVVRKVLTASIVGSIVEWYDYTLYGIAAAIVFPKLFFPSEDPAIGTLLSLATFAIGFLARPVAAAILGNLGDKIGRSKILIFTILLMGISTIAIGLLPTYAQIGVTASLLLVVLRIFQACGAGAEYAGAILIAAEYAPKEKRGLYSALPYIGVAGGSLLATATFSACRLLSGDEFIVWGWRIPFILSVICVAVGLWLRRGNIETPAFKKMLQSVKKVKLPIVEVFKTSRKSLLMAWGLSVSNFTLVFLYWTFLLSYVTNTLGIKDSLILNSLMVVQGSLIVIVPFYGWLSDKIGRRAVLMFGTGLSVLMAFPLFLLLNTKIPMVVFGAFLFVNLVSRAAIAGAECAWFTELFETKLRFSGFAVGREWPSIMGGIAPVFAQAIVAKTGGGWWPIAVLCLVVSALGFVSAYYTTEMRGKSFQEVDEYYEQRSLAKAEADREIQ